MSGGSVTASTYDYAVCLAAANLNLHGAVSQRTCDDRRVEGRCSGVLTVGATERGWNTVRTVARLERGGLAVIVVLWAPLVVLAARLPPGSSRTLRASYPPASRWPAGSEPTPGCPGRPRPWSCSFTVWASMAHGFAVQPQMKDSLPVPVPPSLMQDYLWHRLLALA
jgi:hypothetical protein